MAERNYSIFSILQDKETLDYSASHSGHPLSMEITKKNITTTASGIRAPPDENIGKNRATAGEHPRGY
jgi:hypothetical protein